MTGEEQEQEQEEAREPWFNYFAHSLAGSMLTPGHRDEHPALADLGVEEAAVFVAMASLADAHDPDPVCQETYEVIGQRCRMAGKRVGRYARSLEKRGLITSRGRKNRRSDGRLGEVVYGQTVLAEGIARWQSRRSKSDPLEDLRGSKSNPPRRSKSDPPSSKPLSRKAERESAHAPVADAPDPAAPPMDLLGLLVTDVGMTPDEAQAQLDDWRRRSTSPSGPESYLITRTLDMVEKAKAKAAAASVAAAKPRPKASPKATRTKTAARPTLREAALGMRTGITGAVAIAEATGYTASEITLEWTRIRDRTEKALAAGQTTPKRLLADGWASLTVASVTRSAQRRAATAAQATREK